MLLLTEPSGGLSTGGLGRRSLSHLLVSRCRWHCNLTPNIVKFLLADTRDFPSCAGRVFHVKSRVTLRFDLLLCCRLFAIVCNICHIEYSDAIIRRNKYELIIKLICRIYRLIRETSIFKNLVKWLAKSILTTQHKITLQQ
jgi:hypothetical protein